MAAVCTGSDGKKRRPSSTSTLMEVGDDDGVAVITISNPPLNLLSLDVMISIKHSIDEALQRDEIKAIVITGSGGKFTAGFDVTAFGGIEGKKTREEYGFWSVEFITNTLEAAKKPLVAAIDGPAFGGGLEIALACHARISTIHAQLGLTELRYGILPGFGGTQRLPRLVGLPKALEMMLMSKPLNGKDAKCLGLVDAIVPADELLSTARCWALDVLEYKKPWVVSLYKTDRLPPLAEARRILKVARNQAQKQAPNLRHPLVCIDVIEGGIVCGPREGLWKEADALQELRQSETCRSLVHMFFAQRRTSKVPGISDMRLQARTVNKVSIIGGGLMGSEIASVFIMNNFHVTLKEEKEKFLLAGVGRVKANLQSHVKKGKMTQEKFQKVLSLLNGDRNYNHFNDVDLVIEALSENVSRKLQIISELERCCPPHCTIACNTPAMNLNLIAKCAKSPDRVVGARFFSPPYVMPFMEIVRLEKTSPQVIIDLLEIGKKIKKTPIVVENGTGFIVDRMLFSYLQAARFLAECGIDIQLIDQEITKFGMPTSPFSIIGSEIQSSESFLGEAAQKTINSHKSKSTNFEDEGMAEIIFFPVVNEACCILADRIVVKASDIDVASVMGMGFPAYRGGIIFWANSLGSKYICSKLETLSKKYGDFFKPCAYLKERASNGTVLGTEITETTSRL